jgi:DNA-binding XRE family transcriptional regulator
MTKRPRCSITRASIRSCSVLAAWLTGGCGRRLDDPRVGELGKNLREARKRLGLTQEEVAERSGVQAGEVSRIEGGKRDAKVSTLEKLAVAVNVPPGDLLG